MVDPFPATPVLQAAIQEAHQPMIALRNLSKTYYSSGNRICILREVDFDIAAGETLAVVGASGIGKSTLLHILGALDVPDSGSLLFQGQDVLGYDRLRMAGFRNQMVGFVFQFHHLLPEFTALENTMMPGLIRGMAKQRAREAAEAILVRVGLEDRLSFRVDLLSGGEQQRVALARALVLQPPVLLADEPTGNLDRKNSAQVHALLRELNQELNMTLVVVTHNMELASMMTRRVTIIDEKLVEKG
jgi:lipoprotein-releasing system ATP-binding protein